MHTRPVRLPPGADLRRALEALARDEAEFGGSAFVIAGIRSLAQAAIRLADADDAPPRAGAFEILTLCGSLSTDGAHLQVSVADASGAVSGGHVAYGNIVRTTAEVLLLPLPDWRLGREADARTGYAELSIHRR